MSAAETAVRPLHSMLTLRHRDGAKRSVEFVGYAAGRCAQVYWPLNGHFELDLDTGALRGARNAWELDVLTLCALRREYAMLRKDAPWSWGVSDADDCDPDDPGVAEVRS